MKRIYLLLFCTLLLVPMLSEASRGVTVKLKASEQAGAADVGNVQLYGSSYALVIGNDAYNNGWPPLSGAIQDADMIAKALKAHGFDVSLKKNLTSSQLKTAFEEFFVLKGTDPKARLFVWFAGHGHTLEGEGYLVPVDAPNPNSAAAMFKLKAVSLRNFGIYVRSARAKHAFSVFDSCFSGTVFESQRALPPAAITQATIKPVRQFLTSGDANQKVSDNGSFRKLFIRAIHGASRADANADGYLTASELGLFMTDKVTNLTHARQTPRYGKLNDLKYDQGDFVFQLPQGSQAAIQSTRPAASSSGGTNQSGMELALWNSIKDSNDPAMFQAYLAQFPSGIFSGVARIKAGTQVAMSSGPKAVSSAPGKYSFTIDATPSNATIKILNIKPKYNSGMLLKPGRYHVSVSRSGYESKRLWVDLGENDLSKAVGLNKLVLNKMEFVTIPSGSFSMGSKSGARDEKPIHTVHINSFKMSKYEVTQSQWRSVMGSNPSKFKGDNNPVEQVSWNDMQIFIRKLNSQTGQSFRLPSEAEWEYAARAGTTTKWSWGNSYSSAGSYAWYNSNSSGQTHPGGQTHPVGQKQPNGYGLYDMHGNVYEWVQDCSNGSYNGAPSNGSAWLSGNCAKRVLRGGSWRYVPNSMRSAHRNWNSADTRDYSLGFRLVQD